MHDYDYGFVWVVFEFSRAGVSKYIRFTTSISSSFIHPLGGREILVRNCNKKEIRGLRQLEMRVKIIQVLCAGA